MAFPIQTTILYVVYALLWGYFLLARSRAAVHLGVGGLLIVMGFMIGLPPLLSVSCMFGIIIVNYKYLKARKATA